MPDRLNDALANSEPRKHRLQCPRKSCGYVVKANTAFGAHWAMRRHRKHAHPASKK